MARKSPRRGDTLIEVMLAVGIFSMVAVAVISVMSGGTSSSQTALETTLAREEIDNQAEALRFIQRAYIGDVRTGQNSPYGRLWQEVTNKAYNSGGAVAVQDLKAEISNYHPSDCKSLYDGGEASQHGFVIDPKGFTSYETKFESSNESQRSQAINEVLVSYSSGKLQPASTYPHLIYGSHGNTDLDNALISDENTAIGSSSLYRSEGIYVIAVKDPNDTNLANSSGHFGDSAYYDFYIRTCWYGTGDQSPSSISTVIRLYNPDVITDV